MATRFVEFNTDWMELAGPLNMMDNIPYAIEFQGEDGVRVYTHDKQLADPDPVPGAPGHVWFPFKTYRSFSKKPGWTWWARTSSGTATAVITEL